jgi:hypothetical protein
MAVGSAACALGRGTDTLAADVEPSRGEDSRSEAGTVRTGRTYFVAPSGSDTNAGTATAPFRTIQRAASVVSPGDEVVVGDGVYTDEDGDGAVVRIRRGGTAAARVTFRAANRWKAMLDGRNGLTANGIDVDDDAGHLKLEGFEIAGFANRGQPPTGRGSSSGIDLYDGGHDTEIIGNHIHHIGRVCTLSTNTNGQVAIFVQQPNVTIEGNLIHDIGRLAPNESGCQYDGGFTGYQTLDHGIYLNGGSPGADGAIVRNNVLHGMNRGWAVQVYRGSLAGIRIVNNTFAFGNPYKRHTHIVLDAAVLDGSIVNNIFYDASDGRTIEAAGFSGTVTITHNVTTSLAITDRLIAPSGMTVARNQLATDPRFVDPAHRDFRLRSDSPAIDAASATPLVTADFERRSRPGGAGFDAGAYEYQGGSNR